MEKNVLEKLNEFKEYMKKIEYLESTMSLLNWDMSTNIPVKGLEYRGEILGYLSSEVYKLKTSDFIKSYEKCLKGIDYLDVVNRVMVEKALREYYRTKKIPEAKYKDFVMLKSKAQVKWEEARSKNDFEIFKPYLEKIVETVKEFTEYWGYKGHRLNALFDENEPGITVEKLDVVFKELKEGIINLLDLINKSKVKPDSSIFEGNYPKKDQYEFGKKVIEKIGYDLEAGRVDESAHPFTIGLCNKDVRITTSYDEKNFLVSLFAFIHEAGHGIYEQNISDELSGTGLATGGSMGLHESQSRFYENILGRSKEFWTYFYPELRKAYPDFKDVTFEDFYSGLNKVEPSLIRINADELTYSLHIIIRYEIEKALFSDEIKVEDLPRVWNEKYKEYLGIDVEKDSDGVLQDVHWSWGMFGYFPSYALGNLYGAQLFNAMTKKIPNINELITSGNFNPIEEWLKEKVHKHGDAYKPNEILEMATGESMTAKYFIDYLNKKYKEIYKIS